MTKEQYDIMMEASRKLEEAEQKAEHKAEHTPHPHNPSNLSHSFVHKKALEEHHHHEVFNKEIGGLDYLLIFFLAYKVMGTATKEQV